MALEGPKVRMSFLFFPFGKDSSQTAKNGWDDEAQKIVARLVNSLQTSTLLPDKRDALKNLHGYSKKFASVLASFGFKHYMELFHSGVQDGQTISLALQIIRSIIQSSDVAVASFVDFLAKDSGNLATLAELLLTFGHDPSICEHIVQLFNILTDANSSKMLSLLFVCNLRDQFIEKLCSFLRGENDVLFVDSANLLTKWAHADMWMKSLLIVRFKLYQFIAEFLDKASLNKVRYETVYLLELLEGILHENWEFSQSLESVPFFRTMASLFIRGVSEQQKTGSNWPSSAVKNYTILLRVFQNALIDTDDGVLEDPEGKPKKIPPHKLLQNELASLLESLSNLSLQFAVVQEILIVNTLILIALIVKENEQNCHQLERIVVKSPSDANSISFLLTLTDLLLNRKESEFSLALKIASLLVMNAYFLNNSDAQLATISTLIPTPEGSQPLQTSRPLADETVGNLLLRALFDFPINVEPSELDGSRESLQQDAINVSASLNKHKPFLASLLFSFIIHSNRLAIQKASQFPVTVDFLHEFNQNPTAGAEKPTHDDLLNVTSTHPNVSASQGQLQNIPTIPQNIVMALEVLSSQPAEPSALLGYIWLLNEFLLYNPSLIQQLITDLRLAELLKQTQGKWPALLFATVVVSCANQSTLCNHLVSYVTGSSTKPVQMAIISLSQLSVANFVRDILRIQDIHALQLFTWPVADFLELLPDALRIIKGQRPYKIDVDEKIARYELQVADLVNKLHSSELNKQALLVRVTELEDEQQGFLERIGVLEDAIQKLKKSAKVSDILAL